MPDLKDILTEGLPEIPDLESEQEKLEGILDIDITIQDDLLDDASIDLHEKSFIKRIDEMSLDELREERDRLINMGILEPKEE